MTWNYHAPSWLGEGGACGGHLQTLWPALISYRFAQSMPRWHRERWATPDHDVIDTDYLHDPQQFSTISSSKPKPLIALFHGLEGSSQSHYATAFAQRAEQLGWNLAVIHFRGCAGELNLAPRTYHAGDFEEFAWMLGQLRQRHAGDIFAVGVSLGGNALLRWAQENGASAANVVRAIAAISAPVDLSASGHAIDTGVNRWLYSAMFLRSLRPKALAKLKQYPGLFDQQKVLAAKTLYEFDDVVTAPLHGFRDTADYWRRASSKPMLPAICVPTLLLNARNDPFVPAASLPNRREVGRCVTVWQPDAGGHVGFPNPRFPGATDALPQAVMQWLQRYA